MRNLALAVCLLLTLNHTAPAEELLLRIDRFSALFGPTPRPGDEPLLDRVDPFNSIELLITPDKDFTLTRIRGLRTTEIRGRCTAGGSGEWNLALSVDDKSPQGPQS